jgi:hypothetical protein
MAIELRCRNEHCGRAMRAPDDAAGKEVRCPLCGLVQPVPTPGTDGVLEVLPGDAASPPPLPPVWRTRDEGGPQRPYRRPETPVGLWVGLSVGTAGLLLVIGAIVVGAIVFQQRRSDGPARTEVAVAREAPAPAMGRVMFAPAADPPPLPAAAPPDWEPEEQPWDPRPPFRIDPQLEGPGPKVYLSAMKEFDVQPGPWPLGKNGQMGDPEGHAITVKGKASPNGLGLHPPSKPDHAHVRYALGRKAAVFRATAAFNDTAEEGLGPVRFLVLGDGKELWRSPILAGKAQTAECVIDVSKVEVLELRVRGEGGTWGSHAVWVEPRLFTDRAAAEREAPAERPR